MAVPLQPLSCCWRRWRRQPTPTPAGTRRTSPSQVGTTPGRSEVLLRPFYVSVVGGGAPLRAVLPLPSLPPVILPSPARPSPPQVAWQHARPSVLPSWPRQRALAASGPRFTRPAVGGRGEEEGRGEVHQAVVTPSRHASHGGGGAGKRLSTFVFFFPNANPSCTNVLQ